MTAAGGARAPAVPWTVWIDGSTRPPREKVADEERLLDRVAAGGRGGVVRLWTSGPSLVLGRLEARRLRERGRLPEAYRRAPVLVRPSGGTAVPHGPGELNVTLCYPVRRLPAPPEPEYRRLLVLLQAALRRGFGLEATEGSVPGSFCDGRFNLVVGGRKVAGTAQAQRRGAVLVHGTVMVAGHGADRLRWVEGFYRDVGEARRWDPARVASLSEVLGRPVASGDLLVAILETLETGGPWKGEGAAGFHGESVPHCVGPSGMGRGCHG